VIVNVAEWHIKSIEGIEGTTEKTLKISSSRTLRNATGSRH